jgi:ribonuclease-3
MITVERERLLSEIEQSVGYCFRSRALLDRALTHRSYAHEQADRKHLHNEALEFLGDSVLGLVVSSWLLQRFPDQTEGKLSKMKGYLVSEPVLVELAEAINLGRYILLNRGEEKTGGRQKHALLADAYEALIGVIYLDGGLVEVTRFLQREMAEQVGSLDPEAMIGMDFKSALQERLQALGSPAPEYSVVEIIGPDHRRTFRVALRIGGREMAIGEGRTIKLAQQDAARTALVGPGLFDELLREEQPEPIEESAISADHQREPVIDSAIAVDALSESPAATEDSERHEATAGEI